MPSASAPQAPATQRPFSKEFETLFEEHYPLVYRTAYGITGRVEDAEDVVQTIFLRLLQRGASPEVMKNPAGYLYRAAVNGSLTVVEHRHRHAATEDADTAAALIAVASPAHDDDMRRRLYQAITQLNRKSAYILILRYLHERSDADIARLLGTSRGVIAVTLFRARKRLKKLLRDQS
jgi:RNA polymerase sigma-70 factor (ECF subfamily)